MNWHRSIDPARLGTARIDPSGGFPVGHVGTWTLTITIGDHGIDDGGAIFVAPRLVTDAPRWQCDRPTALGYCSVTTNSSAQLILRYESHHGIRPWRNGLVVRVVDGFLSPGDQVMLTLGDRSHGSPGAMLQSYPERQMPLQVFIDAFATGEYYPLPGTPTLTVVPGEPSHVEVILPSRARPGNDVPIFIRVSDRWFNPVDHLDDTVEITSDVPLCGLPLRASVATGVQQVGTFRPSEPGVFRIQARIGVLAGTSNPCAVADAASALFWADMHGQTEETVGTGSLAEYFTFARDKALLDVTAWQGNDFQITDAVWDEVRAQTRAFYRPGRFVTFLGYEWSGLTPGGGDHNILFRTDDGSLHRSSHWQVHDDSDPSSDRYPIRSLWTELRQRNDILAIPHVGGRYADLAQSDPELCPLVEIHSHHGTFEWLAADAFRHDLIVGFCAQSDDHFGRPGFTGPSILTDGDFVSFNVFGGLTAIAAEGCTRDEIWTALRARHCYATTGARILLDVRAGGHDMGTVLPALDAPLQVSVSGTAPLLDVQVLGGMDVVYRHPFEGDAESEWIRIEWSGVRVKGRRKMARWEGSLSIDAGMLTDVIPYAFDRAEDAAQLVSPTSVAIHSRTAGDIDGVFIKLPQEATLLLVNVNDIVARLPIKDLRPDPIAFSAGGVNCELRVSRTTPFGRPLDVSFDWAEPTTPSKPRAYWIRVVQCDGHMAWSSPIYVRPNSHA